VSYILDALNKSEQEQKSRQVPGLDSIHDSRAWRTQATRKPVGWFFAALAVLAGLFLIYWTTPYPAEVSNLPAQLRPGTDPAPGKVIKPVETPRNLPVEEATPTRVVSIAELPLAVQQEIPDIIFSSHIYADDPSLRMVNINGQNVREGDTITDGIKLAEISEEGVILGYRNYAFTMSIIRDWSAP
jgi:hypothetical protein|tara:strand:- start:308 stop:865 length:558 start_codon:yes stop_codon:yes gene_type:complete